MRFSKAVSGSPPTFASGCSPHSGVSETEDNCTHSARRLRMHRQEFRPPRGKMDVRVCGHEGRKGNFGKGQERKARDSGFESSVQANGCSCLAAKKDLDSANS